MSIEAMKQALDALEEHGTHYARHEDNYIKAITALRQAIEFAEMVKKGTKAWADTPDGWVDDLRGGVEPVAHLWECLGRWSAYLASHGGEAELAPPQWLCDAINAATAPPKREWVGLTDDEEDEIAEDWGRDRLPDIHSVTKAIDAKLREKNHG
jgi:hypothetical protein